MRLAFVTLALIAALAICDDIPKSFDAREQWKECQTPILNQGQCGSCWSFSASTSMSGKNTCEICF
jgi:C1A family cysteine protease